MNDQNRISPYNINTIPDWKVMRMKKKNQSKRSLGDPIPNFPEWHQKTGMADSKENFL